MKKIVLGVVMALFALGAGPVYGADIALLNSATRTANYFDRNYTPIECTAANTWPLGRNEYNRYWKGWKWVFDNPLGMTQGTHYVVIGDGQVTEQGLAGFDILVLSNNASLGVDQMRAIRQWVLRGGKLLATFGSGYEEVITHPPQREDLFRTSHGETNGLHDLWQDPYSKLFTSTAISTFTNVVITNNSTPGPAQGVTGVFLPNFLGGPGFEIFYGHWANLLIQRRPQFNNAYAFLRFYNFGPAGEWVEVQSKQPRPAILNTKHGKGEVVYYAFAPEFGVALEFDVAGHCANDTVRYPGGNILEGMQGTEFPAAGDWLNLFHVTSASAQVRPLMKATMEYLCGGDCTP